MYERRHHYRVQAEFVKDVSIEVSLGDVSYSVKAKDLSAGGVGLLMPLSARHSVRADDYLRMTFTAPWCESLHLSGQVIRKSVGEDGCLDLAVAFTHWEAKRDSVGHRLRRVFNERRVHRVVPPVSVQTTGSLALETGETQRLTVHNVGIFGAMLELRGDLNVEVEQSGTLTMEFPEGSLALLCVVRHLETGGDGVSPRVGVQFHTLSERLEKALRDYVVEMQRAQLKQTKIEPSD